jgi:uncharacterized caspase-like protein
MLSFKPFAGRSAMMRYRGTEFRNKKVLLFLVTLLLLQAAVSAAASNTGQMCSFGEAVETDGHRRLALIVGVGQYKNEAVPDLDGPPNDAKRFYNLLTDKNGYGFPVENVCLLLNEEASTANFKQAFDKALVERARANDVAVVFFAGHGSQAPDKNGDEADNSDETLMFHDARTNGVLDMLDDEFNQILARLHKKTKRITVILDSCNSGTATRGPEAGTVRARFFKPMTEEIGAGAVGEGNGEGAGGMTTEALPGLVLFSAATDSNPALEKNGRGIFTDALLQVMMGVGERPLTYAQVARLTPPLVSAESPQVPYFHGDLTGAVFGNQTRTRPIAWEVKKVGPPIEIAGPPLAGIGQGAEFRIYDGSATGADTRDPNKAKATVVATESTDLNAKTIISAAKPDMPRIEPGDLSVLVRPADAFITIKVRMRPSREAGGIPDERAKKLRDLIGGDSEAQMLVELTEGPGDFELSVGADKRLVLKGPENRPRNTYQSDSQVPQSLWQHARQRALLHLRGEGGQDFRDNETLLVSLKPAPAAKQNKCSQKGIWEQAEPNSQQVIPLCYAWNVQVTRTDDSPIPLLIGALILSTDGSIYALPRDDRKVRLQAGESYRFNARGETFLGTPPLDVQDRIIVFGTHEKNPVSWSLFTETAATRGTRGPGPSGLHRALDRYLKPGTRGIGQVDEAVVEESTWTMSTVTMRVEANPRFLDAPVTATQPIKMREYTIADFDIRPYLPDDENTALYKVLQKADWLARAAGEDGFGYKQHAWDKPTDEENLRLGIDCSRSIWFAFTRADLPYNQDDRYLTTAMMVSDDTLMADEFDSCSDDPNLQIGDILVYRDDTRGDGHVVMVIDPEKRIGWGSHGWDGNPRILPVEPDKGVEYQKIKFKSDWERWDRKTMTKKACWRYRAFVEETQSARGLPGLKALENICVASRNCGR